MTKKPVKTRFAPSPTGHMHFGTARTALFNYLFARHFNGQFLLRLEDTDKVRSNETFSQSLLEDMAHLGLDWDEGPIRQSERGEIYREALDKLTRAGHTYPCYCQDARLQALRDEQIKHKRAPRYDGHCRSLSDAARRQLSNQGIKPSVRFRLPADLILESLDLIKGSQNFKSRDFGDFIVQRQTGDVGFLFSNALDDAMLGVTHALRGEDHLSNTPRQIMLLQALQLPSPHFGHFPLIIGPDGTKLSKRNGSRTLKELLAQGYHPMAIVNYLANLGHSYRDNAYKTLPELSSNFDIQKVSISPARFDESQLEHAQKEALNNLSLTDWLGFMSQGTDCANERAALNTVLRPNVLFPAQLSHWQAKILNEQAFVKENEPILHQCPFAFWRAAIQVLGANPGQDFKTFLTALKDVTPLRGKDLFQPLRIALSDSLAGPELQALWSALDTTHIRQRFERAASYATDLQ